MGQVKKIESVNPTTPKENAVHDVNFHLDAMHKKTIEQMVVEIAEKDQKNQQGRKWAAYESRVLSQKAHATKNDEIIATHNDGTRNVWNALSVAAQVGAGIMSGALQMPAMQMIGQGVSRGFDTLSESNKNKCDAERTGHHHVYQRKENEIRDESQILQETGQAHERDLNTIDRLIQNQSRLAELVISNQ